jgi:hypothetical protein
VPPTAEEAKRIGLTLEEAQGPPVEVWPDNWLAVCVFNAMSTQWRTSMAGRTGLDYAVLQSVMRLVGVPASERAEVFDSIRTLEGAALETMRNQE